MKWLAFVLIGSMLWFMLSCFSASVGLADEDTATSGNILPNAGTTSSSMDNFDLDGVQSGSTGASNKQLYTQWFYNYLSNTSTKCMWYSV